MAGKLKERKKIRDRSRVAGFRGHRRNKMLRCGNRPQRNADEIRCIVLPEPSVIAASLRGAGKRFLKPEQSPSAALWNKKEGGLGILPNPVSLRLWSF
jgi:hypothetical protein